MSNDRMSDEDDISSETAEAVPEADALEQAQEIVPGDEEDFPSEDAEVPEADAIEQSRPVPRDDERA